MATAKLTLSTNRDTIELAKSLASEEKTSVSKLFAELVNKFAQEKNIQKKDSLLEKYKNVEIPEWIKSLTGVAQFDSNIDYDEIKYEYLKEKYGA